MDLKWSLPRFVKPPLLVIALLGGLVSSTRGADYTTTITFPSATGLVPSNTQTLVVSGTVTSNLSPPNPMFPLWAPPAAIQVTITRVQNGMTYNTTGSVFTLVPGTGNSWNYNLPVLIGMGGMPAGQYRCTVLPLDSTGQPIPNAGKAITFSTGP